MRPLLGEAFFISAMIDVCPVCRAFRKLLADFFRFLMSVFEISGMKSGFINFSAMMQLIKTRSLCLVLHFPSRICLQIFTLKSGLPPLISENLALFIPKSSGEIS